MKFDEVIGQQEAKERLVQMVTEGRLPHALLLCGPQGCGKMALALAFASYLLSEAAPQPQAEADSFFGMEPVSPVRNSNAEAMLAKFEHPDLHFSFPVIRPSGTSAEHKMSSDDFIQQWRQMLQEGPYFTMDRWLDFMDAANQQAVMGVGESDELLRKLSLKSSQGGYKVVVMWLPERMNQECANKILKLLEEPPTQTVFLLVCEEPELLLETIRSRTQRIDIRRIRIEDIEQALISRRGIEPDDARRIAHSANGSWQKALETLDTDNENQQFFELFVQLMRMAYKRDVKGFKLWSEQVAAFGRERQKRFLTYSSRMVRENFMYNFGKPELCYMSREEEDFAKNFARFINEANIVEISELLARAQRDIGQNANAKVVFYDLALQMIVLLIKK
ncbi:MAG: ATP-binding protein [Prevotella sp.]|nr:ATP-binding protein [Prevotella sp.]